MTKNQSAKTFSKVQADLRAAYQRLGTERAVASEIGISAGMVHKVMVDGYEPHTASIRIAIGLPATLPAPVCPVHGVVHARTCRIVPAWVGQAADWLKAHESH